MKRVLGCGLTSVVLLAVVTAGLVWGLGCYRGLVRAEVELEASWTEIEILCRQRENLVSMLASSLDPLDRRAFEIEELERANATAASVVLSPEILRTQARFDEFRTVQSRLTEQLERLSIAVAEHPRLARNPTLERLAVRLDDWNHQWSRQIERFNGATESFNARIAIFPASWVARLLGFDRLAAFPRQEPAEPAEVL